MHLQFMTVGVQQLQPSLHIFQSYAANGLRAAFAAVINGIGYRKMKMPIGAADIDIHLVDFSIAEMREMLEAVLHKRYQQQRFNGKALHIVRAMVERGSARMMGPPADNEYAVEPVGVAMMRPD